MLAWYLRDSPGDRDKYSSGTLQLFDFPVRSEPPAPSGSIHEKYQYINSCGRMECGKHKV